MIPRGIGKIDIVQNKNEFMKKNHKININQRNRRK
jgi:hypothetical protein